MTDCYSCMHFNPLKKVKYDMKTQLFVRQPLDLEFFCIKFSQIQVVLLNRAKNHLETIKINKVEGSIEYLGNPLYRPRKEIIPSLPRKLQCIVSVFR